jgi:cytochrome c oxidase cbb3-type subunit I/II
MVPRLWGTKLWSTAWANMHFWIGLVGILFYVAAMWVSGITQGLMLNALQEGGSLLKYPDFVETLNAIRAPMLFRALGGGLYLLGFLMLAVNLWKTVRAGAPVEETREVPVVRTPATDHMGAKGTFGNDPFVYTAAAMAFLFLWFFLPSYADVAAMLSFVAVVVLGVFAYRRNRAAWVNWYESLIENYLPFTVLVVVVAAIGGLVQIIPTVAANRATNIEDRLQKLYTPLELAGRDIYINQGCHNCHSQMIRMIVPDLLRYGDYSRLGESIYDHPSQWGSKRTGPDLAREGGKRPDSWHFAHMMDPRSTSPGSNMPPYPWLYEKDTDIRSLPKRIAVQRRLGVPYPAMTRDEIEQGAREQAVQLADRLRTEGLYIEPGKEVVALIAYLQKLGSFEEVEPGGEGERPRRLLEPALPDETRREAVAPARLTAPDPAR